MFRLKTWQWGNVEVAFSHINPVNEESFSRYPGTQCFVFKIFKRKDAKRIAFGNTNLHVLDYKSYCKERGRKLSLARALKDLGATQKMRTKFWNAYFETQEIAREKAKENHDTN